MKLIIKNPSNRFEDITVDIELSQTISDLKKKLSEEYPSKPSPSLQKIIFAGRILKDEEKLSALLQNCDLQVPPTFHLVISRAAQPQPQPQAQNPFFGMQQAMNNNFQNLNVPQQQIPFQQPMQPPPFQVQPQPVQAQGENFWLILKLAFFVYLFSQGSMFRVIVLSSIAFLIFLQQTGRLRGVIQVNFQVARAPPNRNDPQDQAQGGNANVQDAPRQHQAPPRPTGFIGELTALVIPFFYSLIPTYQPVQHV